MKDNIPESLYYPDTTRMLEQRLKKGIMPQAFIRRMRLINLMSAIIIRKIDPALIAPFDVEDLHHIMDKQISQDAVIDQLDNQALAEALTTGNLEPLWTEAQI